MLAQSRPARLAALVDAGLGTKGAAQIAMVLSVVAFVCEHGANAGHDCEGGQEQPKASVSLTLAAVARQATGTPSPSVAMWYLVPLLPRSVGLGPVRSPPRLARTKQVSRIRSGWPRSMPTSKAWTFASRPLSTPPTILQNCRLISR